MFKRFFQQLTNTGGAVEKSQDAPVDLAFVDINQPAFIHNPYPFLHHWRENKPVTRMDSGAWLLTRRDDIASALNNPALSNVPPPFAALNARQSGQYICADVANNIIPFMDGPKHAVRRQLVSRAFVDHLRQQPLPVQLICDDVFKQRLAGKKSAELLGDFCTPFTSLLMATLFGLENGQHDQLKAWSDWFFYLFSVIPSEQVRRQLDQQLSQFREFFIYCIEQERLNGNKNGLLNRLQQTEDPQGNRLTEQEIVDTCMLLWADGVNTDYAIANAILALIQNPGQIKRLQEDNTLVTAAANECLRYESPSLFIGRTALHDMEIGGHQIKRHAPVLLLLAAANRDPQYSPDPDTFDILRRNNMLTFGQGQHTCLGQQLAKQCVEAAIKSLLPILDRMELTRPPHWQPRTGHRWLEELPVRIT